MCRSLMHLNTTKEFDCALTQGRKVGTLRTASKLCLVLDGSFEATKLGGISAPRTN